MICYDTTHHIKERAMKNLIILISAVMILSSGMTAQSADSTPSAPKITGTWSVNGSTAKFRISFENGTIKIAGWDSNDNETFVITDISWDGTRLKGTFTMPSTHHTTYSDLELVDERTLKGEFKGDAEGEEIWTKDE